MERTTKATTWKTETVLVLELLFGLIVDYLSTLYQV
jgi:hypothetical protein